MRPQSDDRHPLATALTWFLSRFWPMLLLLAMWQAWVSLSGYNAIVMPYPSGVVGNLFSQSDVYLHHGGITLFVAVTGLCIGMICGAGLASLAWSSGILSGLLTPVSVLFSSIPVVTVIPILARVLGYDIRTEIAIVGILSFFPAFVFVSAGLKDLPAGSADVFKALGGRKWRRWTLLALPSAIPHVMTALRVAAPQAVLAAMLAEFLMGTSGLGYLFVRATGLFDMDSALATSLIATALSVTAYVATATAERKVRERWR